MGDTSTAMRDPIFYRWHGFIDNIFQQFKSTLPRYTLDQLNYSGVTIESISIESDTEKNTFNTFWQQSDVDLSRGMDFQPRGPVFVRFTHLNHQPFSYRIVVDNNGAVRQGTCRIFMAPKFDESGRPWLFVDQRTMFIELDRFRVDRKYNFERLCNSLSRVERFINWRKPIPEAYFPKLDSLVASRGWPSRVANQSWSNLRRETDQVTQDIDDLERWRDRIFEVIHNGRARRADGTFVQLTENEGIDILGNIIESSILSPDRDFYGDLHNMGHVFTSYVHDPDHRHLVSNFNLHSVFKMIWHNVCS
uniref:Phenoloxidase 1-like n=1 Tax=Diabrotica virgifera virgifera TaxID=50390 RepID=A0A6P7FTC5_DIAVI